MSSSIRIPSRPATASSSSARDRTTQVGSAGSSSSAASASDDNRPMTRRRRDKRAVNNSYEQAMPVPTFATASQHTAQPGTSPLSASMSTSGGALAVSSRRHSSSASTDASPRNSYLNSYMSHQDHVVLNISSNPNTVRLVSYVRSGQGFNWNTDMFLPSSSAYLSYEDIASTGGLGSDELALLEQRVPIHEIHLDDSDEELYRSR